MVVIFDRKRPTLDEAAASLGDRSLVIRGDLRELGDVGRLLEEGTGQRSPGTWKIIIMGQRSASLTPAGRRITEMYAICNSSWEEN